MQFLLQSEAAFLLQKGQIFNQKLRQVLQSGVIITNWDIKTMNVNIVIMHQFSRFTNVLITIGLKICS